jgi:hypothetical protein
MAGFVSDATTPIILALDIANTSLLSSVLTTGTIADAEGVMNQVNTTTTGAAGQLNTVSMSMWQRLQQIPMFAQQKATTIAENAANMAKQELLNLKSRILNIGINARQNARDLVKEGREAVRKGKTFRFIFKLLRKLWPVFKYGFIMMQLMKGWGLWMVKTVEVIIYRIFHFKDCFFWYLLEIIGCILWLPFGFIIWLFDLHEHEKILWGIKDDFDEFIYGLIGFHLFHYSDTIMKKCYSQQFPPFPYSPYPFPDGYSEEAFIEFIIDWFMPPSPKEIGEGVSETVKFMKQSEPIIAESAKIFVDEIGEMFVA